MIDPRRLDRARVALRVVRKLELEPAGWAAVMSLVGELLLAVRARDAHGFRTALAELEQVGAVRGLAITPGDGQVIRPDLLARLDELSAELAVAAAEIRRIPHIDIEESLPLRPGMRFVACVRLDTTPSAPDESAEAFVLRNPRDDLRELSLDVWLTATAHFIIEGSATAVLALRPADPSSSEARFTVTVRDPVPANAGPPALRATFDYRLRASGAVRRAVPIELANGELMPRVAAGKAEAGDVLVDGLAVAPDLEIVIERDLDGGSADRYSVLVRTGLLGGVTVTGTWVLEEGAEEFVRRVMADFADENATRTGRRRSLESAGLIFFAASPECFQSLYWRLIDAGTPPKSMFLISDERSIPWELMIPRRRERGEPWQTMPPLGVSCAVGRWHQAEHFSPRQHLLLSDSLVFAPEYAGAQRLPSARMERDLVFTHFPGLDVPGTFDELDAFYAANSASLLHFICHGRDATLQAILLLENQTLSAQQALTGGLAEACRKRHPLVFLNACEIGRPGLGLARVGGFPASFIACEAGAIIAPLWAVNDSIAHRVATDFYQSVVANPSRPFADVLRCIRARAYDTGGVDSFAAYCLYGDPFAAAQKP